MRKPYSSGQQPAIALALGILVALPSSMPAQSPPIPEPALTQTATLPAEQTSADEARQKLRARLSLEVKRRLSDLAMKTGDPAAAAKPAAPRRWLIGGLRAYVDPATGLLTVPPPSKRRILTLSPEMDNALSTSHEGLVVRELADGTQYVDLQGRFYSALMATVDEDGNVELHHDAVPLPAEPAAPDEDEGEDDEQ